MRDFSFFGIYEGIKGIGGGVLSFPPFFNMLFSGFSRFQNGLDELSEVYRTHFIAV